MTAEEIFNTMRQLIAEQFALEQDEISLESSFVDDLGADSLDLVDMLMSLEDEFDIGEVPDEMIEKIRTVGQLVALGARMDFTRFFERRQWK